MAKMRNSVITEGLAGSAGSATFRFSAVGQQLTARSHPKDARTDRQLSSRGDFTEGSDGWGLLDAAGKASYLAFAKASRKKDPVTGKSYTSQPRATYIGLASKFAQISPGQPLPSFAPETKYKGDTIGLAASLADKSIVVTASGPNNASSKTEILVARMPSTDRAPREEDYVTHSFVKFAAGAGLSTTLELGAGVWAVAAKFVCPQTGEEKGLRPLGTFVINLAVVQGGLDEEKPAARAKKAA